MNNNCTGLLHPGELCNFQVNTESKTYGLRKVNIEYDNDDDILIRFLDFNVTYIPLAPGPNMTFSLGKDNLIDVPLNTKRELHLEVKNTGNVDLINIKFTTLQEPFSYITTPGFCAVDGSLQ